MELSKVEILKRTHYGLNIYAHILRLYYPGETVIKLKGRQCDPVKNPFNNNKPTLNIVNNDWLFVFHDSEISSFSGDPMDFAAKHYQLNGTRLLERLNKDMNLNIGSVNNFYKNAKPDNNARQKPKQHIVPQFSYFQGPVSNIYPTENITLTDVYKLVKSAKFREQTNTLRSFNDSKKARDYKKWNFSYVTFSGTFKERNDNALIDHSGLLTIDFDHLADIEKLKADLLNDEYFETELMFVSPSGDGLKWIIPVDLTGISHAEYFTSVANYISSSYGIKVDPSGKDISRACFLPYDNNIYINPKYL